MKLNDKAKALIETNLQQKRVARLNNVPVYQIPERIEDIIGEKDIKEQNIVANSSEELVEEVILTTKI